MQVLEPVKRAKFSDLAPDKILTPREGFFFSLGAIRENIDSPLPSILIEECEITMEGVRRVHATHTAVSAKALGSIELSEFVDPDGSCAVRAITKESVLTRGVQDGVRRRLGC